MTIDTKQLRKRAIDAMPAAERAAFWVADATALVALKAVETPGMKEASAVFDDSFELAAKLHGEVSAGNGMPSYCDAALTKIHALAARAKAVTDRDDVPEETKNRARWLRAVLGAYDAPCRAVAELRDQPTVVAQILPMRAYLERYRVAGADDTERLAALRGLLAARPALEQKSRYAKAMTEWLDQTWLPSGGERGWWQASDAWSPAKLTGGAAGTFYADVKDVANVNGVEDYFQRWSGEFGDVVNQIDASVTAEVDHRLSAADPQYLAQKERLAQVSDTEVRDEMRGQYGIEAKLAATRVKLLAEIAALDRK
jgi:hypothetical protein